MVPIVHRLEFDYGDQVRFTYLDIDDPLNQSFKEQLPYAGPPSLILLDGNGEVLQQWVGFTPAVTLETALLAALDTP
jgi:hypothetical protein